jgi:amyloid beta precursor protein binding protein 1
MPGKTPFTHIIVVSPFTSSAVIRLSPEIPTFLVYSIGFTIALRIAAPTQCIVETHSTSLTDLRLLNPWEELLELALERTKDLDIEESCGGMSDHEHGHVPYVFLLIKYLEDWKASHDGKYPSDYKEKNEFKSAIMDKMRTNVPGGSEENYEEAVAVVLKHVRETELSPDTRAVLEDPRCKNPEMDVCLPMLY